MKTNRIFNLFNFETVKSYSTVLIGSLILAIGYSIFIVPHHIVPGGIFGLSIVIHQFGGLSAGTIALIINIPLLLIGSKILGKSTGFKTAFSMVSISLLVDLLTWATDNAVYVNDILVSSIFGGILIGLAVFVVMRAGATTGGNDILVRILVKKIKMPYNLLILFVDGIVVLFGVFVFGDFTMAAYCIIAIVAISKTLEHLLAKSDVIKTVIIFSHQNNLIREALDDKRNSEPNFSDGLQYFPQENMTTLTISEKQLPKIESLIYSIDANAHIAIMNSQYRV